MKASPLSLALVLAVLFGAAAAQAETYDIDSSHSTTLFRIKHAQAAYFYGVFTQTEGVIQYDPENPTASMIGIKVESESLETFSEGRNDHIKGPDFFNVGEYPHMGFKSTAWEKVSENQYKVTGDFTLLGQTNTITVDAEFTGMGKGPRGKTRIGFEAKFSINRSDYGMTKYLPDILGDEVQLTISVEGILRD